MKSKRKVRSSFRKSDVVNINEYIQKHCLKWGNKRLRTDRFPVCNERNVKDLVPGSNNSRLSEANDSDPNHLSQLLDVEKKKEYRRAAILRWKAKRLSRISESNVSRDCVLETGKKVDRRKKKVNRKTSVSRLKKKSLSRISEPNVSSDHVLETGKEADIPNNKKRRNVIILKLKKRKVCSSSEQNISTDHVLETGKEVDIPKKKEGKRVSISKLKKRSLCDLSKPNISSDHVLKRGKVVDLQKKKDDKKASIAKLKKRRVSRSSEQNISSDHILETGKEDDLQKKKEGKKASIPKLKKRKLARPLEPNKRSDHVRKTGNEVDEQKKKDKKVSSSKLKKRKLSRPTEPNVNGDHVLETGGEVDLQKNKGYREPSISKRKKRRLSKPSEPNINGDPIRHSRVLESSNEANLLKKKKDKETTISRKKKKRLSRPSEQNINSGPNCDFHVLERFEGNRLGNGPRNDYSAIYWPSYPIFATLLETSYVVNVLNKKEYRRAAILRWKRKRLSRSSEPNIRNPNCHSLVHETSNDVNLLVKTKDREASVPLLKPVSKPFEQNINSDPNCDSHVLAKPSEPNINGDPNHEVNILNKNQDMEAFISGLKKKRLSRPSAPRINADLHGEWPHLYETCDDVNPLKTKENRRASILRWKKKKLSRKLQPNINGDTNCDFGELEKRKEVIRLKKKEYRSASILRWKKKGLSRLSEPTISCPSRFHVLEMSYDVNLLKRKEYRRASLSRWKWTRLSRPSEPNICIDRSVEVVNVVTPQLDNFSIRNCIEEHVISVADIASLLFRYSHPLQLHTDGFRFLVKVNICVFGQHTNAHQIVCLLQQLQSLKFLEVNSGIFKILPSSMELISYQPCPFANLKRLKIYPYSLSMSEHPNGNVTMSTKVKNYLQENSPSTIFTTVSNEDIAVAKNAMSAENLMRKLQELLVQWKADSHTNMTHALEQGNARAETEKVHFVGKMTQIERYWEDLNEQMVQGKRKTYRIISISRKIAKLLTNVPPSQRTNLQVKFLSLCVEAYITMKIAIEHTKIQFD